MSEFFPESHYTDAEQLDVFINWGNELSRTDPEFAETLIASMVAKEFPDAQTLDKTE